MSLWIQALFDLANPRVRAKASLKVFLNNCFKFRYRSRRETYCLALLPSKFSLRGSIRVDLQVRYSVPVLNEAKRGVHLRVFRLDLQIQKFKVVYDCHANSSASVGRNRSVSEGTTFVNAKTGIRQPLPPTPNWAMLT